MASGLSCAALDSTDLLFDLSFDHGLAPDLARGSAATALGPSNPAPRLVEGVIGNAYLFGGPGGTIEYFVGETGARGCAEPYGLRANLVGEKGTIALWIKPLTNTPSSFCNPTRLFSLPDSRIQITRSQHPYHVYSASGGDGYFYGGPLPLGEWMHLVLTWRKGEQVGYLNGQRTWQTDGAADTNPLANRLIVAQDAFHVSTTESVPLVNNALMDELQIFRRPLAPGEVRSLFERGHVLTHQGGPDGKLSVIAKPERAYARTMIGAPRVSSPLTVDGDLKDWGAIPVHGGWVERRVGVLDHDPSTVRLACDDQHLYVAVRTEVDKTARLDLGQIWYPNGEFKDDARDRDSDVDADDYAEVTLKDKSGHVYRFAFNDKGALLDSRDGDKGWNANARLVSRCDGKAWTAELAIPLAEIGVSPGGSVAFNVNRSWKRFASAQNTLCPDEHGQAGWGTLVLGAPACAAVESLGQPDCGDLRLRGEIAGPAGQYRVRVIGQGYNQAFTNEQSVAVSGNRAAFAFSRRLPPGDLGVVVEVFDPSAQPILTRSVPVVYAASTAVELVNYPGWRKLDATVAPLDPALSNLTANVAVLRGDKAVLAQPITAFTNPSQTVRFDTSTVATGTYEVVTRLLQGGDQIAEDRQPYEQKPLPEWYHCAAGVTNGPPIPWTPVRVSRRFQISGFKFQGFKTVVECLLKRITFQKTLFPQEIVANGSSLLARPVCLRVKRGGVETVLAAGNFHVTDTTSRRVSWTADAQDGDLQVKVNGWIEFDGFTWITLTLAGGTVDHLALEIPLRRDEATLTVLGPAGLVGTITRQMPCNSASVWLGNEKAGLQCFWESPRGWVLNGESCTVTPTNQEVRISIPLIQKPFTLTKPREIELGWALTPSRPVRSDMRLIKLYKGVTYGDADYTQQTPNYPVHRTGSVAWVTNETNRVQQPFAQITAWYAFGPYQWAGSPEYADWWREWRESTAAIFKPDPNANGISGSACHNSSSADMHVWLLERYLKSYPQRGIYFDCMGMNWCANEAHGCGYLDDRGVRQPVYNLMAERRYYERIYNVIKAADPLYGWVRFDGWGPLGMMYGAFADDNWIGEGYIFPLAADPLHNYFNIVDLAQVRINFVNEPWGHLNSWLTDMASGGGDNTTPAGQAAHDEWYGRMISPPPTNGQHGVWTLPRWRDYEHVAGLGMAHDIWQIGGNDRQVPWYWCLQLQRLMHWDDQVKFLGYWDNAKVLKVDGGAPEKVVCSLYYRPARSGPPVIGPVSMSDQEGTFTVATNAMQRLAAIGERAGGWVMLVPMNNTDQDVTLTLKPDIAALGVHAPASARMRDVYRAFDVTWDCANAAPWHPEPVHLVWKAQEATFPLVNDAVTVTVPKRSFRMLHLEEPR